jgi:hypothetical protein
LYFGDPLVSVDAAGGAPATGRVTRPAEWEADAPARLIRFAARLTTTGVVTWLADGSTSFSTVSDPDFLGSLADVSDDGIVTADVTGSGFTADGSPTASGYVAFQAAASDGTDLTVADFAVPGCELDTGHSFFRTVYAPAGSTFLFFAVTLSATPPTVTDGNGFTWETVAQQALGAGAYMTLWKAKITRNCGNTGEFVQISQRCDSGIGLYLVRQEP